MACFLKVLVLVCAGFLALGLVYDFSYAVMLLFWELSYDRRMRKRNRTRGKEV